MIRKCYKQDEFVARIEDSLGVRMGDVSCKIVDTEGMAKVMGRAGWNRSDTIGVVGFQVGRDVYVLESAPWTVLHELIHRAGVNADRLSSWVAEGLTEAIARELKQGPDEHQPTYPEETGWVTGRLLPGLGMSAVQLGAILAKDPDPPRRLAQLMVAARPDLDEAALRRSLAPQSRDRPSFNRGSLTRLAPTRPGRPRSSGVTTGQIGSILMLAGFVLLLPSAASEL